MSTKSKTGAKLVDSIRKSKTGAVASKTAERPNARETAAKPRSSSSKSRGSAGSNGASNSNAGYSSKRRVWPD